MTKTNLLMLFVKKRGLFCKWYRMYSSNWTSNV